MIQNFKILIKAVEQSVCGIQCSSECSWQESFLQFYLILLHLNEDLTQAIHAFATSEAKLMQQTLPEAKPCTDWLLDLNTSARVRGLSVEHALIFCSIIGTTQFSHWMWTVGFDLYNLALVCLTGYLFSENLQQLEAAGVSAGTARLFLPKILDTNQVPTRCI